MKPFKSWKSFWDFSCEVKRKNRFLYDDATSDFLETLFATSKKKEKIIQKETILWRAQIGGIERETKDIDGNVITIEEGPLQPKRMKPLANMFIEGRANPRGISYLYLSDHKETALAEVRPWLDVKISIGQFKVLEELKIMDCAVSTKSRIIYFIEPEPKKKELSVWSHIDEAFSKPVNPNDNIIDYIPTQIIAELFKSKGYHGLSYKSSCGEGLNYVLFDLNVVKQLNCFLYETKEIKFKFSECANPYFVKGNKTIRNVITSFITDNKG